MSVSDKDIHDHQIPFYRTGFDGGQAEYAHRTVEVLEELIALRAELEQARELLAAYRAKVRTYARDMVGLKFGDDFDKNAMSIDTDAELDAAVLTAAKADA